MKPFRTVGKSPIRIDALEKATGKAKYTADIIIPKLKFGVVLRSIHHYAKIVKIDYSKALKLNGVIDILTAKDIPGDNIYGPIIQDRQVLADKIVRFMGEPIAIIVAKTKEIAEKARDLILVDYNALSPVFNPIQALDHNDFKLHNNGNIASSLKIKDGNINRGFQQADIIVEEEFKVPTIYHAYLETEAATAVYCNNKIQIYASSQEPFIDRDTISSILGKPKEYIEIITTNIGGGFGGKQDPNLSIMAALASWKTKKNIKFTNTRKESILGHPKRHACIMQYKLGITKDGKITALHAKSYMNNGAYCGLGPAVAMLHTETASGAYKIPNIISETNLIYTNTPSGGAMRGFGAPQSNFAIEGIICKAADKLSISPNTVREKNILKKGDYYFTKVPVNQPESVYKCLNIALDEQQKLLQHKEENENFKYSVGLALALQTQGIGHGISDHSTNQIKCLNNGKIEINIGSPEIGQGLKTVAAQIVAESLGIDYSDINIAEFTTVKSPDGGNTCASRRTYLTGNSLLIASEKLKNKLIEFISEYFKVQKDELKYENGYIVNTKKSFNKYSIKEIANIAGNISKEISATGDAKYPDITVTGGLPIGLPHLHFSFGAAIVKIKMDKKLKTIYVTDIIEVNNVGQVINRANCEGQVEGSAVMALGYALTEELTVKDNNQWNDSLAEYILPTSMDSPDNLKSILLEIPEKSGPFGAMGIGETPIVPVASAIADAVYNATGVRVTKLPIKPDDLLR